MLVNSINPMIKLTEKCNYNCNFCRYANHRRNDHGISEEIVNKIINESINFNINNGVNKINVVFHGGEPLLFGKDRFLSVLQETSKAASDRNVDIEYFLQTNASLITAEWSDLFKEYNIDVGISLDGPVGLNEHGSEYGEMTIERTIQTYHSLREKGVRCGILSVITNKHLENVRVFFDFLVDNDIDSVALCYCYSKLNGNNVNPKLLGEWLIELYDLYFNTSSKIRIREFDNATRRIVSCFRNEKCFICRKNCGRYLTFTPNGDVRFCDDFYDKNNNDISLGNIAKQSITEILSGDCYNNLRSEVLDLVATKCNKCDVNYICRGGCARNDLSNGNFFCDTYMIIYPYIEKKVKTYLESKNSL